LPGYDTQRAAALSGSIGGWCPQIGLGWDYVDLVRDHAQPLVHRLTEIAPNAIAIINQVSKFVSPK